MASRSIDQSGILEADGTLPADFVVADNLANLSVTARTIDPSVTTDEITEGIANLYYTDNRARLAITVTGGGYYDNANGIITVGGPGLNTTNVIEGSNLYFTNARARAAISNIDSTIEYNPITGTIRANVIALGFGENVVTVQGQTGVVTLTTTDLPEGANLYFSNTRAQVAIRAGLGISINNGQVNVNPNANLIINEVSTSKLTVYEPGNTAANIELVYDDVSKALIINSNISPLTNETYNLGTVGETFNELYVKQIYANNITLSNTITADEFIGNVTGDLTKFILVSADNNSLLIDQSSNPDLFLPKGTKVRVDLSSDALIGIGFDIGQYNAANNDIANGANLSGLTYFVNNQRVSGFTNWAASFNDANARSIVYSIPQSAPFNLIYYSLQFTEWRGNITVAPPTDTDDLREGSLNFYYTDQRVDDRLFQVADGNVGLIFDQGTSLLTLAQDISTDAGVVFDNVTANAFFSNAFYGTLYGNIVGQLSSLSGLTTTELPEGANAYFTVSRVRTNLNAQNGITYSSITGMFELEPTNVISNFGNANIVYGNPNSTITIQVDEWGRIENVTNRGIVISSSNVLEGANLFFTNARVVANVSNLSINVLADVDTTGAGVGQALVWNGSIWIPQTTISGNVTGAANIANLVLSLGNHTTSNLAEGANLYFTNERVQANVSNLSVNVLIDVDTTGASVGQALVWNGTNWVPQTVDAGSANTAILANTAIFANVANLANLVVSLENHTTSNLAEGANLYFTNARVWANVSANIGFLWSNIYSISGGGSLTTSNVAEGANLYFTNDRVWANVGTNIGNLNSWTSSNSSNIGNLNSWIRTLTTTGVAEGANLYFTDNRVWANVGANIGLLWDYIDNITTGAGANALTTSNVAEGANLYFTNARVYSALFGSTSNTKSISVANIFLQDGALNGIRFATPNMNDTANIHVLTSGGQTIMNISVGDNTDDFIKLFAPANTDGIQFNNNKIYHAGNDGAGSGLDADLLDGQQGTYYVSNAYLSNLTTTQVAEGANLYFTNSRARATVGTANSTSLIYYEANGNFQINVESVGAVTSVNGQTGAINLTTTNIAEGANLYYTNARVYANVINLGYATTGYVDGAVANLVNSAPASLDTLFELATALGNDASFATTVLNLIGTKANTISLTTANVVEQGNLYFTNTRARAAVGTADQTIIYYEGNGNFQANITAIGAGVTSVNGQTGVVTLTTSNIVEGANLYFSNTRVQNYLGAVAGNIIPGTSNVYDLGTNAARWRDLYLSGNSLYLGAISLHDDGTGNLRIANSTTGLIYNLVANTGSLIETGTKVFFSNDRVWGNVSLAIANVSANVTNLTTSNVAEGANLYFSNARAIAALGGQRVGTSNAVTFANVTANVFSGNLAGGANNTLVIQTASNVTGFVTAPTTNFTFLRYDSANGVVWADLPGANTISYLANSISLDPSYGTYNSGNVLSIRTVGDYNLDANNYYSINETATTPGYIAYIDFINVQTFNRIAINLFYTQNSAHVIYVDLWNKDTLAWDSFGTYNGLGTYYQFALAVLNDLPYIQGNSTVSLRLYHASAGNTGHNHRIDYVALEYSNQGPQGPKGTTGATGATGAGVATGGDTGQILYKANSTNYATYWGNLITSNVMEGANLWFTNTRVRAAVGSANTSTLVYYEANGNFQVNVETIGTVTSVNGQTGAVSLTTTEIAEGANLYFTNARTRTAVSGGLGVLYNQSTGVFSLAQNVSTHSDVTFANLTVTGNLTVQGNALIFESNTLIINDPLIQIGKNPVSGDSVDLGFFGHYIQTGDVERHAGLFRDATDGNFKLFTNLDPEPVTIVDTANASFRYANLFVNQLYGNVNGFINTISNFSTTNLIEGTNQYFTQARARQSISVTGGGSYNSATGVISIDTVASDNVIHTEETFTGNGVATIFTLTSNATRTDSLVVIDGLVQFYTTDYTISGNTSLIFTSPPADGETIKVLRLQTASSGGASSSQVEDWGTIDDAVAFAEDYGSIE